MKKLLLLLPLLACSFGFAVAGNTPAEVANAADESKTTLTVQNYLKNIWNGDGVEGDGGFFKYYVGHGTLSTSSTPGYAAMTKSMESEGNFTGTTGFVVLGGSRFVSMEDDRVMLKIRPTSNMNFSVSANSSPTGAFDGGGNELKYYVFRDSDVTSTWHTDKIVKTVMVKTDTPTSDFEYEVSLSAGDTFVFEWGFQWSGDWNRYWDNVGTSISFKLEKAANEATLYYADMIHEAAQSDGDVTAVAPFASYGFYHGNLANSTIEKLEGDENNSLSGGDVYASNWNATFENYDCLIIKIVAQERLVLHVYREVKGTEFLQHCNLRYWVNTTKVMDKHFDTEPDASVFDAYVTLNTNDTFYLEVGFIDWSDQRSMAMLEGGDIHTSLPQFVGYGVAGSTFAASEEAYSTTLASAITCYNGEQTPTLDGKTWAELETDFKALDVRAQALVAQAKYEMVSGSAVGTNGYSDTVANAVAKYDQVVSKYSFVDFMSRNPKAHSELHSPLVKANDDSSMLIVFAIIGATSLIALISIYAIHKKKSVR